MTRSVLSELVGHAIYSSGHKDKSDVLRQMYCISTGKVVFEVIAWSILQHKHRVNNGTCIHKWGNVLDIINLLGVRLI